MGDRALAHIEKIVDVYSIKDADNVEMVQLLDFHVLVKKGQFKVNDLVCYIEIDSILPDGLSEENKVLYKEKRKELRVATGDDIARVEQEIAEILSSNTIPHFEFLRSCDFKIKAKKYNKLGIVSMGIVFSLDILPSDVKPKEGLDVTDILGITKIIEDEEEDAKLNNHKGIHKFLMKNSLYRKVYWMFHKKDPNTKGDWLPIFPSKSDEEGAQKCYSKMFQKYGNEEWYVSEKMEGQNISAFLYGKNVKKSFLSRLFGKNEEKIFGVCSRTNYYPVHTDGNKFWDTIAKLKFEEKLRKINKNLFIRGEHCGGSIQGNIYKFPETKVFLFEVWDIDQKRKYSYEEFISFCKEYGFEHCPILDDKFKLPNTVQEILDYSNGISVHSPKGQKVLREGIVLRLKNDSSVSFKVRSPEYLVKKK